MLYASWRSIIETGGEVQVSRGRIHEWWKARRRIGCSIRQSKCCNASFAPFSRPKTVAIEKGKTMVFKSIFVLIFNYGYESCVGLTKESNHKRMRTK